MDEKRGPEGREGQPGREGAKGREGVPGVAGPAGETGSEGPKGARGSSIPKEIKLVFIIMTLIFFVILAGFSWFISDLRDLSRENKTRISEIQKSRIESCKGTYSGIRKVFKPFFPPKPRTKEQQAQLDKFNGTIDTLKKDCKKQTKADQ